MKIISNDRRTKGNTKHVNRPAISYVIVSGHRLGESRPVGCTQEQELNKLGLGRKGLGRQGRGKKVLGQHTTVGEHRTPSVEVHSWTWVS